MSTEFDLTATAELAEETQKEPITHLATKVRNKSPEFDGEARPDEVVRAVLQDYLRELAETEEQASELQQATRERLGLSDVAEATDDAQGGSDAPADDVAAKQEELQERILG